MIGEGLCKASRQEFCFACKTEKRSVFVLGFLETDLDHQLSTKGLKKKAGCWTRGKERGNAVCGRVHPECSGLTGLQRGDSVGGRVLEQAEAR